MDRKFDLPEVEVVVLDSQDIIVTSLCDDELPPV